MTREIAPQDLQTAAAAAQARGRYPADLAEFVQEASIGVMLIGADGLVRWANKAEYERLGLSHDDFVGKPYRDFFTSSAEADGILRRLFEGEVLTNCEVSLRHCSGSSRFVALDGEAVWRDDDAHARLLTRDVTSERKSREAIRLQEDLLNAVGQAVVGTDLDGRVIYWNKAAERMYGWPADEAIGRGIRDLVVPEGELPSARAILDSVAAGTPWSGEFTVLRRDGSRFDAFVTDTPLLDEAGQLTGFIGVSADISALKSAEIELRSRQRRLEGLGESLPAIVAMASVKQGFHYFNRTWYEFTGLDRADTSISWPSIIHQEDYEAVRKGFQQVLRGETMQQEARLQRHDGVYRWFLIRAVPLPPTEGEPGTAVITGLDITDIKSASQQLESAKNQLETVLRGITDGVTAQDASGRLVYANDAAARMIGFESTQELLETPQAHILDRFEIEDDQGQALDPSMLPASRALAGEATDEMLLKFRSKDSAEERYSLVKAAPVLDAQGRIEYVVDIFRDVTDKVLADREREELLRREREARLDAEKAIDRVARLQAITARLAGAWTPEEAGEAVLQEAVRSLNASVAAVVTVDDLGRPRLLASHGYAADRLTTWKNQALDQPRPLVDLLNSGASLFFTSEAEFRARYPGFAAAMGVIDPSSAYVRMKAGARVLGGITVGFAEEGALSDDDKEFIVSIAQQCALAIARTELYQAERDARTRAEDAEARYRILAEAMPQIIWTALPDGSVDYYSPQFFEFTGLKPDEKGWEWQVLVHPDDAQRVSEAWRRSVETGEEFDLESRLRRADGSYCWVLERALPLKDATGKIIRWLGTITDIDDQKRAQERFGFLAEASAILSSSLDYEETLVKVASLSVPLLADWCSVHVAGDGGRPVRLAVAGLDEESRALADAVETAEPLSAETPFGYSLVLKTGRARLWREVRRESLESIGFSGRRIELMERLGIKSAISVPVVVRGKVMAALSLAMAESHRRFTERDLETAIEFARHISFAVENALLYREAQAIQEELRLANEAKDEFLGLMSHELRTPITTLYGGAKILRSRARFLDEEHKESLLSDMENEAEGMHRMIEDLLVLARTGSGEQVSTEPILANHLIDKVVRGFQLHRPGRQVMVRHDEDLLPVMADNTYMEQILRNLLSNADKYSPAGLAVEVEVHNSGEEVVVSVLDRGRGIDPEETELIFTRFYRAERTSRGVRGMGLGLTVCKKLVEAQGGRIWARPRQGGGTELSFALPAFTASYDDV